MNSWRNDTTIGHRRHVSLLSSWFGPILARSPNMQSNLARPDNIPWYSNLDLSLDSRVVAIYGLQKQRSEGLKLESSNASKY